MTAAATESHNGQRDEIERALRESNGRIGGSNGAAVRMGVKRTTLLSQIKKLGINPKLFPQVYQQKLPVEDSSQSRNSASLSRGQSSQ